MAGDWIKIENQYTVSKMFDKNTHITHKTACNSLNYSRQF